MNANELADLLEVDSWYKLVTREEIATMLRQQQVLIENLNGRIERMIEKQSHYEAMAHAGGFEAGRELGMKQERERNNEPVAWISVLGVDLIGQKFTDVRVSLTKTDVASIPLYTHPVKEQSTNERIEMLKEMVEKIANPAGWIGYYEGKPATFLFKQEDVPRFLKNTDPVGSVIPLYTHPVKELTDKEIWELHQEHIDEVTCGHSMKTVGFIEFARAILRKAQEK